MYIWYIYISSILHLNWLVSPQLLWIFVAEISWPQRARWWSSQQAPGSANGRRVEVTAYQHDDILRMWVFPKIGIYTPKMDGENHGKPYCLMDDLGGKTHYFRKHPCQTYGFWPQIKDVYRTKLRSVFFDVVPKIIIPKPKKKLKSGVTQSRLSNVAPLQVLENSASSVLWKGGCQQDDWSVSTQVHLWTDLGSEAKDAYKVGNWCTGG